MPDFTPLDTAALLWFLAAWAGYTLFADRKAKTSRTLVSVMHAHRVRWMTAMLLRENRIVDSNIVRNLLQGVAFFASTTIFIIAGLIAVLGARDHAIQLLSDLPFAAPMSKALWELKLLLLMKVFVYAFFKFTWSLRQFNYFSVIIGCSPPATREPERHAAYIRHGADVSSLAAKHFNRGLRAYYFGLAALGWFVNPWLFMIVTTWVVAVLYWREFRSDTLQALSIPDLEARRVEGHGEPDGR